MKENMSISDYREIAIDECVSIETVIELRKIQVLESIEKDLEMISRRLFQIMNSDD